MIFLKSCFIVINFEDVQESYRGFTQRQYEYRRNVHRKKSFIERTKFKKGLRWHAFIAFASGYFTMCTMH